MLHFFWNGLYLYLLDYTYFSLREICETRQSLTKVIKDLIVMVMVWILSFFGSKYAYLQNKRLNYDKKIVLHKPVHIENSSKVFWVSVEEEFRWISGNKLFAEPQDIPCMLVETQFEDLMTKKGQSTWCILWTWVNNWDEQDIPCMLVETHFEDF